MINVAGGTYLEYCREPAWNELFGSGLRAAEAITSLGERVRFHTFIGDDSQRSVLEAKAESKGIELDCFPIPRTLAFEYLHPLSKPVIAPELSARALVVSPQNKQITAKNVLRFGVIEGSINVDAEMAVYDPQSPSNPRPFSEGGSKATRLAIVANRSEVRKLTGVQDSMAAGEKLRRDSDAEVVVMKCGADGCTVFTAGGSAKIPAFKTTRVWPIGSGDIFSAVFSVGWMTRQLPPETAAIEASRAVAHFVETKCNPTPDVLQRDTRAPLEVLPADQHKQIYLAGPFFNLPQRWLIEEFYAALRGFGVRVFSPLHDVGRGSCGDVYGPDMKGLQESGVVLACLDGLDTGTIYEIGYAHARGVPVIAFFSAEREEDLKMPLGGGALHVSDFATALYWTVWVATCK